MAFKPQVIRCEIEDQGETFEFYVKEPSGREMLRASEEAKGKELTPTQNAELLFSRYVVTKDGKSIGAKEVDEMLDMRMTVVLKVSELVMEKVGLTRLLNAKKA